MKPGDYVEKFAGESERGKRGTLLEIVENAAGNTLVHVLTEDGEVKVWFSEFVKRVEGTDG